LPSKRANAAESAPLGLNCRAVAVGLERLDRGLGVEFTARNNVCNLCIVVDADFFHVGLS